MIRTLLSFFLSILIAIFPGIGNLITPQELSDKLEFISVVDTADLNILLKDKEGNIVYDSEFSDQDSQTQPDIQIPDYYDARQEGLITSAKAQDLTGACWAFAAISAAETNLIKKGLADSSVDLSEAHLTWFGLRSLTDDETDPTCGDGIFIEKPYDDGGNWFRSVFNLARWSGAETEENAPFTGIPAEMGNYPEEQRYASVAHLQNSEYILNTDIPGIKEAIIKNGSITASYYHNNTFLNFTEDNGVSYYQRSVTNTNHTITVIGWDDSYSKDNFKYNPGEDGAWLVKNSWGSYWGDGGCFWLSYKDTSLSDFVTFDMESADNYDNNYQYDGFGYKGWAYLTGETKMSMANVFTPDSLEELKAVSFYTVQDNVDYTVKIYTDIPENGTPTDGKLKSVKSGHLDHRGYFTTKLDTAVTLKAGSKYSIVVSISVADGYNACIPLEYPEGFDGAHNRSYSAKEGQSYYTVGDDYTQWTDSAAEGYNNVCIKAFTDETELSLKASSVLSINLGYLAGVTLNMKTDFILNQFENSDAVYENGFVKLYNDFGKLVDAIEISFYADIDDNGEINEDDYTLLHLMVNAEYHFNDKKSISGDLNFDKEITKEDLDLLSQYLYLNIESEENYEHMA